MITDDPGTPGNGHWENNLAIAFEHRPNEWLIDAPAIDLNYGWGDHILDEERSGFDMSMFPRIIFNVAQSSVRRGLADAGTRFQIPFQLAKKVGPVDLDLEFGPLVSTVGRSEFFYGMVGGMEVSKKTTIMAELHGTSRTNFTRDALTLNFGWRHKLNEHAIWIASLGHELRAPQDDQLALIGYLGVQLLY